MTIREFLKPGKVLTISYDGYHPQGKLLESDERGLLMQLGPDAFVFYSWGSIVSVHETDPGYVDAHLRNLR